MPVFWRKRATPPDRRVVLLCTRGVPRSCTLPGWFPFSRLGPVVRSPPEPTAMSGTPPAFLTPPHRQILNPSSPRPPVRTIRK